MTARAPSPTADATRLVVPERQSPAAKIPGHDVSTAIGVAFLAVMNNGLSGLQMTDAGFFLIKGGNDSRRARFAVDGRLTAAEAEARVIVPGEAAKEEISAS